MRLLSLILLAGLVLVWGNEKTGYNAIAVSSFYVWCV